MCCLGIDTINGCYYNDQNLSIQALDMRDDITTLNEDLKQEMTVGNYVPIVIRVILNDIHSCNLAPPILK